MTTYTAKITGTQYGTDTITIYRDGANIAEVEVETTEETRVYDEAIREAIGTYDFEWIKCAI